MQFEKPDNFFNLTYFGIHLILVILYSGTRKWVRIWWCILSGSHLLRSLVLVSSRQNVDQETDAYVMSFYYNRSKYQIVNSLFQDLIWNTIIQSLTLVKLYSRISKILTKKLDDFLNYGSIIVQLKKQEKKDFNLSVLIIFVWD